MGRKKKSLIEKSPFKLRHRKLADGRLSLFPVLFPPSH